MVITQSDLVKEYINNIKFVSIPIAEVVSSKGKRFDASVYCTEGRAARKKLDIGKFPSTSLRPNDGLVSDCLYPNRFKRIYVDSTTGLDFLMPSQLNDVYPKSNKYISPKTEVDIEKLKVKRGSLLLTRSGTIGNLTYVSDTLENKIFSDDVIRMYFNESESAGYVYAFLKSKTGRDILTTNNYGAVIQHIEPSHLAEIKIPLASSETKKKINSLVVKSFGLRDQSNKLIDKAQSLLIEELNLPPIFDLPQKAFGDNTNVISYTIPASQLNNRFNGSYHVPIVDAIVSHIKSHSKEIITLGNKAISNKIFLPGRFKRVYVKAGQGTKFIGSKQIGELNPINTKYLSVKLHKRELEELELKKNMILISRSGTIGNIKIVPKHWASWVINEHVIRLIPASSEIAGFIYAWLDTDYGKILIKRFIYGALLMK